MRRVRALALSVASLAVCGLAAACSGFPSQGPIVQGRKIEAQGSSLQIFAAGPTTGDQAKTIVAGFLNAGSDFHEDHRVAHEYLSSPQTAWRSDDGVTVVDGLKIAVDASHSSPSALAPLPASPGSPAPAAERPPRPRDGDVATVDVTGMITARVDANGLMTQPATSVRGGGAAAFSQAYTLVARGGQWRISRTPPGLVLSPLQFDDAFRAVPLYFADSSGQWLVPDMRWFPALDSLDPTPTATLVVKALLDGPAPWFGRTATPGQPGAPASATSPDPAALATGAPPRTSLTAVSGVQIEGDVAHVDLTKNVQRAEPEQRVLLHAQLLTTLEGLAGISDVVLTSDQAAFEVPDGLGPTVWSPPAPTLAPQLGRDAGTSPRQDQPLCLTSRPAVGELDRNAQGKLTCAERKDLAALTRPDLTLPTRDAGGTVFAGVAGQGTSIVAATPEGSAEQVLFGSHLTPPSIDNRRWIWSASADGAGSVLAGRLGEQQRQVSAPWLAGARVKALRISPEGARAFVLVARGASTQAFVAGVERDASGNPVALSSQPLRILTDLVTGVDAGWSDDQDVVVLGIRRGYAKPYLWRAQVGGEVSQLLQAPAPPNATGLAVGQTIDVYIRTADGKAVVNTFGAWQPLDGVRDVTLPG